MNSLSSTLSESMKYLGEGFIAAYYLPAAVFVLAHLLILIPIWTGHPTGLATHLTPATSKENNQAVPPNSLATSPLPTPNPLTTSPLPTPTNQPVPSPQPTPVPTPTTGQPSVAWPFSGFIDLAATLTDLLGFLLLPFVVGIILVGLNGLLIRLLEGKAPWLRNGLLRAQTRSNRRLVKERYGKLVEMQKKYHELSLIYQESPDEIQRQTVENQLNSLINWIQKEQAKIEQTTPALNLPLADYRIAPTTFGNVYAQAEEYAYDRYGADAVLFWGRLYSLMQEQAVPHASQITAQKTLLDLNVNFTFLFGLLTVEAILTLPLNLTNPFLLGLVGLSAVSTPAFYQASIGAVRGFGELIKISFDRYRGLILQSFHLNQPADVRIERIMWAKLAAFIQRGQDFYLLAAQQLSAQSQSLPAEPQSGPQETQHG